VNSSEKRIGFHDMAVVFEKNGAELLRCIPQDENAGYKEIHAVNVDPNEAHPISMNIGIYRDQVDAVRHFDQAYFTVTSSNNAMHRVPLNVVTHEYPAGRD